MERKRYLKNINYYKGFLFLFDMKKVIPRTIGYYVENCPEKLIGVKFQSWDWVYDIENIWQDIKTRDVHARAGECDLGDYGLSSITTLNLSQSGFLDCEELIDGINAEKCCPFSYYPSAI